MTKEELKQKIKDILEKMGCESILFSENGENSLNALFNSKDVISFKAETPEWEYSGIQLDETEEREFKISFKKIETPREQSSEPVQEQAREQSQEQEENI